jgi:subtilisin family serine protease
MPFEDATKEQLDGYTVELETKYGPENVETTFSIVDTVLFWFSVLTADESYEVYTHWIVGVSTPFHCQKIANLELARLVQVEEIYLDDPVTPGDPLRRRDLGRGGGLIPRESKFIPRGTRTTPQKRDGMLERQQSAPLELRMVSQEPDTELADDFLFDSVAGEGITVYVVDTGINQAHPVGPQILFLSGPISVLTDG